MVKRRISARNVCLFTWRCLARRFARVTFEAMLYWRQPDRPEGARYDSPGRSPGAWCQTKSKVPKGRASMPQSLSNVLLHIVFSTKNREPLVDELIEPEVHAYLATVCKSIGCPAHKIGGTDDHVHIACTLSRTVPISSLVQEIKQDSSKWMKTCGEKYRSFAWQNGYGAFSIGQGQLEHLRRYIANQRAHHRRESFQDEFRAILGRYQVAYDERYVWD